VGKCCQEIEKEATLRPEEEEEASASAESLALAVSSNFPALVMGTPVGVALDDDEEGFSSFR